DRHLVLATTQGERHEQRAAGDADFADAAGNPRPALNRIEICDDPAELRAMLELCLLEHPIPDKRCKATALGGDGFGHRYCLVSDLANRRGLSPLGEKLPGESGGVGKRTIAELE